ncbi:MAG TPA: hypothetical protein VHD90_15030, partial [Phototrophicaceae bacterium]|nr:hypothetical protein [Phototrophicaceae bacterium]
VFGKLGKAHDSGNSKQLVTVAVSGYGLVDGSYTSEYLQLTSRGEALITAKNEKTKYKAIYDALFSNGIFSAYVNRFKDKSIPHEDVAIDFLKSEQQLSEADAKSFYAVITDNINTYKLVQEFSGKKVIVSREVAFEAIPGSISQEDEPTTTEEAPVDVETRDILSPLPQPIGNPIPANVGGLQPEFHFNIQIHLPENADPQSYDAIFKSIGKYLLGRNDVQE